MVSVGLAANVPETSSEFHARYGAADVERFVVRLDLSLTVEYGSQGQACRMRIEALHGYGQLVLYPDPSMEEVTAVLNEVVPPESRGKELGPGKSVVYDELPPTEYENVTFVPYYRFSQKPPKPRGMDVLFKRPECQGLPKYSEK
jgi:hypothetical protein